MSKAEEKAWEWSVKNKLDPYSMGRAYGEGYSQAEKDLELGWEDIKLLDKIFVNEKIMSGLILGKKEYEEILKRFNKERKEK